jgi:hypothetical protein
MTTRTFVDKNGNSWEWQETPEVVAALKQLHNTIKKTKHDIAELNLKRPHERQTNNS